MRQLSADTFAIGDEVRVCDGPFASFRGTVKEVDDDRERVNVAVLIYGRRVSAELEFRQVEKL